MEYIKKNERLIEGVFNVDGSIDVDVDVDVDVLFD